MLHAQVDKVAAMCKDMLDLSEGKRSVRSNGIIEFAVSRDQFEPHVFYVWERYESNAALGRHNSCTEYQAFMENVGARPHLLACCGCLRACAVMQCAAQQTHACGRLEPAAHMLRRSSHTWRGPLAWRCTSGRMGRSALSACREVSTVPLKCPDTSSNLGGC